MLGLLDSDDVGAQLLCLVKDRREPRCCGHCAVYTHDGDMAVVVFVSNGGMSISVPKAARCSVVHQNGLLPPAMVVCIRTQSGMESPVVV